MASCELVRRIPLDEALARVPTNTPRPIIVKVDLEGGECGALDTGEAALFKRLRADYVWVEAKREETRRCMRRAAARFSYRVDDPRPGIDQNTLMRRTT